MASRLTQEQLYLTDPQLVTKRLAFRNTLKFNAVHNRPLTLRLLMSYMYGAPILDVSTSHTTQHSR